MKLKVTITIIMLCAFVKIYSQNSLSGNIIDVETKEILTGATIYISDLKKGTSTDVSGYYNLINLPKGIFLAEVKFIGYSTRVLKVEVNGNTKLDFELEYSVTEMNELIVTGVSQATEIRQSPIPTSIISKDFILENTATNLIDAIARQPGISQITTGGAISKPVIRGLGYNRIITLNNGVRQEGQQWGDEHGIEIDEYAVDRTEVIKGPGSLMYGSDGLAGVINFLPPKQIESGKIKGSFQSGYQTNNGLTSSSMMTAGNNKGIDWLARVSNKYAHSYSNAFDNYVFNSGFNELNYNGMVGVNKKWGYSNITYSSFNQHIGMVEGNRDSTGSFVKQQAVNDSVVEAHQVTNTDLKSYILFVPNQQINHNQFSSHSYLILGKLRMGVNVAYQQNQRKEFGNPLKPDQFGLYFLQRTLTFDIKYFLAEHGGFETAIGINGMQQSSQNKGIKFLIPEYSLVDYGVFVVTKKSFNKFNVSGGIRFDQRKIKSNDLYLGINDEPVSATDTTRYRKFIAFDRNFLNIAGSIGITYNAGKYWHFKLNGAKGFRAPNASELASNGKHEGTLRYEYGNNNLKAETSFQLDAGISYHSKHITLDMAFFQNRIYHFIYSERLAGLLGTDSIVDKTDPVPAYQYKQGDAVLTGGEVQIDIHPHPLDWLHFENSFSYVEGISKGKPDSSMYLPFIPPAHFQSELRANLKKKTGTLKNCFVKVQYDYYFAQNKVLLENKTETPAIAYNLFNVGTGTDIVSKKGLLIFSVFFSANNIFDLAYQSHLSRIRYGPENIATSRKGVYNMGRNFNIKIIIPLSFKS